MKKKLLTLSCFILSSFMFGQIIPNQVDDFSDGTTQNWIIGNPTSATFPPANVADGGPGGSGDNFLEYTSTGSEGPSAGSKMVIFNTNEQWSGDFIAEGIKSIRFDVKTTAPLNLRIAIQGPSGSRIASTTAVSVPVSTDWTTISIDVEPDDFTVIQGTLTQAQTLAGVFSMRIMSSSAPTWTGVDVINATLQLDNITASTTLSRERVDNKVNFNIYPNPSTTSLNINLPSVENNTQLEVYNILGAKIYSQKLSQLKTTVTVSQWRSAIYLVKISSDTETITKRFVKQ